MEQNWTPEMLFIQIVMQNQQMAMMSMGKLENPVVGKTEINLEFAKLSIDTLDMLKEKTNGNLSDYETKYLDETISQLKTTYVQALNSN